jgi:hypothetical protein
VASITLQLHPDTEQKLRQQASRAGLTLEGYLQRLAERAVADGTAPAPTSTGKEGTALGGESDQQPRYISDPRPTRAEFERLLGDLAAGPPLPVLPADFSRADIYDDHV